MTARAVLVALCLAVGASTASAQNELDRLIAHCGGAQNVVQLGGGNLGCRSTAGGAGGDSGAAAIAGLGQVFMQFLQGLEADAQRRAAEQRARRDLAMQILQQHRQAALNRQDAVRAQQLNEIESRLARSGNLFKGMTGAGAGLSPKTAGTGALQPKTGRAATSSLTPAPAAAAPVAAAAPDSDADALIKSFSALPMDEQLAMLEELRRHTAPAAGAEELRDAPVEISEKSVADLEPIAVPDGMTPEDAKRLAADLFQKETGLDVESVLSRARAGASADPATGGAPAPSPGGQPPSNPAAGDPCTDVGTSVVDLCRTLERVDRSRAQPSRAPGPPAGAAPPPLPKVNPRPLTDEELRLVRVADPFDAGVVFSKLARRHEPPPTQEQRLEVLKMIRSEAVSRYVMEPAYAQKVDALIDEAVKTIRAERAEMELQAWDVTTRMLFTAIDKAGLPDPDAATLLRNETFVRERDAIARLGAKWRRDIQIVEERRLFLQLYSGLHRIQ